MREVQADTRGTRGLSGGGRYDKVWPRQYDQPEYGHEDYEEEAGPGFDEIIDLCADNWEKLLVLIGAICVAICSLITFIWHAVAMNTTSFWTVSALSWGFGPFVLASGIVLVAVIALPLVVGALIFCWTTYLEMMDYVRLSIYIAAGLGIALLSIALVTWLNRAHSSADVIRSVNEICQSAEWYQSQWHCEGLRRLDLPSEFLQDQLMATRRLSSHSAAMSYVDGWATDTRCQTLEDLCGTFPEGFDLTTACVCANVESASTPAPSAVAVGTPAEAVAGTLLMSVSDRPAFLSSPAASTSVKQTLAAVAKVAPDTVNAALSSASRRLQAVTPGMVAVSYMILVPSQAATMLAGSEMATVLRSANVSSMTQTLGAYLSMHSVPVTASVTSIDAHVEQLTTTSSPPPDVSVTTTVSRASPANTDSVDSTSNTDESTKASSTSSSTTSTTSTTTTTTSEPNANVSGIVHLSVASPDAFVRDSNAAAAVKETIASLSGASMAAMRLQLSAVSPTAESTASAANVTAAFSLAAPESTASDVANALQSTPPSSFTSALAEKLTAKSVTSAVNVTGVEATATPLSASMPPSKSTTTASPIACSMEADADTCPSPLVCKSRCAATSEGICIQYVEECQSAEEEEEAQDAESTTPTSTTTFRSCQTTSDCGPGSTCKSRCSDAECSQYTQLCVASGARRLGWAPSANSYCSAWDGYGTDEWCTVGADCTCGAKTQAFGEWRSAGPCTDAVESRSAAVLSAIWAIDVALTWTTVLGFTLLGLAVCAYLMFTAYYVDAVVTDPRGFSTFVEEEPVYGDIADVRDDW